MNPHLHRDDEGWRRTVRSTGSGHASSLRRRGSVDRSLLLSVTGMVALLVGVLALGAGWEVRAFVQFPALVLVVGGSLLTARASFPSGRSGGLRAVFAVALRSEGEKRESPVAMMVALAMVARRQGLLALERPVSRMRDGFLRRAMQMVIDGHDPASVQGVFQAELEAIDLRHTQGRVMIESIGRAAPVYGMMGTVIGLVIMLSRMEDPSRIGPGMAAALLTTLYGLVLSNVFVLPLAKRLEQRSSDELLHKTMVLRGVLAIQAGEHPRMLEQRLAAYLPRGTEAAGTSAAVDSVEEPVEVPEPPGESSGPAVRERMVEAA